MTYTDQNNLADGIEIPCNQMLCLSDAPDGILVTIFDKTIRDDGIPIYVGKMNANVVRELLSHKVRAVTYELNTIESVGPLLRDL